MSQKNPYEYENGTQGTQNANNANSQGTQDLEKLAKSVYDLGTAVSRQVSQKLDEATARINQDMEKKAQTPASLTKQKNRPNANIVRVRSADSLASGLSCMLGTLSYCGAALVGLFTLMGLIGLLLEIPYLAPSELVVLIPIAIGVAGSVGLVMLGRRLFNGNARQKRLERYLAAMGEEDEVPLRRLAEVLRQNENYVKKDLSEMIRRGMLPNGYIDDEEGIFFLSAGKYLALQRRQEAQASHGAAENSPVQELLVQMEDFLYLLDEHIEAVADQKDFRAHLKNLRHAAEDIFSWTKAHPGSIGQVRRLTSYYMPTTLKLLRTYADVKDQQSETAGEIRKEITGALESLEQGFENLQTSLLTNVALDISSEIGAVQTMLAQDGLANSIFDVKE